MPSSEKSSDASIRELEQELERIRQDQIQILNFISHDLKAPMNRLFALLQLLVHQPQGLDDSQKDYLNKMELVIADMRYMLQNLTDFRNLEHRRVELNVAPISLVAFLKKTMAPFQAMAAKKEIQFSSENNADVTIGSDAYFLSRILDNLLSNAIKFSQPGRSVSLSAVGNERQVVISVQDEARGFRPEEFKKLFHGKFQKFSITPTAGESATGLGLYLSGRFAEKIGALLTCETTEGIGSTFSLTLSRSAHSNK